MTIADLAKAAALSFECKKDSMRQNQSGDWKIAFTVQGIDVPDSLTKAFPGTRYMAVLVEIGDDEQPVSGAAAPAAGRSMANGQRAEQGHPGGSHALTSDVSTHGKEASRNEPESGKPRRHLRDLPPPQQAALRCNDAVFHAFLKEERAEDWREADADPAECVRLICGISSRRLLDKDQRARVIWKQLDDQFQAWSRVGA